MSNLSVEYDGVRYSIDAMEKTASWGKGVKLSIFPSGGKLLNSISYSCHPEFSQYEKYQSKTIEELTNIAMSRLVADMGTNDFRLATENGIGLLLPINNA